MEPTLEACPSEDERSRLLSGEAVWHLALPRHLMTGCASCWGWFEEKAPHVDPAGLPLGEPLAMAVITAAMAPAKAQAGRFRFMRPLHAKDARKAPRDVAAFCRLVLHEALPASLQCFDAQSRQPSLAELASSGDRLIQSTTTRLFDTVESLLTSAQRHDLRAISLAYRAVLACWAIQFDEAEQLLNAANDSLASGSGTWQSRVIWHTVAATRERLVGLTNGPQRNQHLRAALALLTAALDGLPAAGTELQRAELHHDRAQVVLALDDPPRAVDLLKEAWDLIDQHGSTGSYLASLVRLAQTQAALAMAKAQPLPRARWQWAAQAKAALADVQGWALIEASEWRDEAREIDACLAPSPGDADLCRTESTSH